jgi:hypothetical protein
MHEDMHQGTCQQQQKRQKAEHMGTVLGQHKKPGYREEAQQHPPSVRFGRVWAA